MTTEHPEGALDLDKLEHLIGSFPTLTPGKEPGPYIPTGDPEGGQDDLEELGAAGDAPNTPLEAVKLARRWVRDRVHVGVGYCLRTIRSLYGVPALYPDAETAWEQSDRKHRTSDPHNIPWGVPVFWTNGGYGHIALSLGGNRCLTTDYVRTGELGVAPISALGPWCGGQLVGWSNDLNEVDVWEPKPEPFGLPDRIQLVQAALDRALEHDAPERRVKGLHKWLTDLKSRQ